MWWRRLRYVLLLIALCAVATCPAAKRACTAKSRAAEADELLTYLADRVTAHAMAKGRVPSTAAGPTPARGCCEQGGVCEPDAAAWASPGWRELGFSVDGPHRFQYHYAPDPSGLSATLRAIGDVDCDGAPRVVELTLSIASGAVSRTWVRKAATPSP
jgi:hypothetical protein